MADGSLNQPSLNASGEPLVHTIGMVIWAAYIVFAGYAYLIFPRGRLESSLDRGFILVFALTTAVTWTLIVLLCPTCAAPGLSATERASSQSFAAARWKSKVCQVGTTC